MLRIKRFSIISGLKLFSRRDVFPKSIRDIYEPSPKILAGRKLAIKIEKSDEFKRQYKQSTNQVRIDKLIEELYKIPISRFEDAGDSFSDTHYLKDYSSKEDGFIMFSKKINNKDRFNYRIYKPELRITSDGKEIMAQRIVLSTCSNHSIDGKNGSYVGGQTGTTWHSPKKSRNKNKNKKKDDLK